MARHDPADHDLDESYRRCRAISRRHGVTYHAATRLLAVDRRRHVHALYALARTADDIVDDRTVGVARRADSLLEFRDRFLSGVDHGSSDDPVLRAVVDTVVRHDIPIEVFGRFFDAMRLDLEVSTYATFDDLLGYMDGSAAAIGEMMLPILRPTDLRAALGPARDLGIAFQLTNFLRDIDEDLDRGRQYLPQDELLRFGVDLEDRVVDPAFVELMRFQIERCRSFYAAADLGSAFLPAESARCIRAARTVYARILVQIERQRYDVFRRRAHVPMPTKLALTLLAR
ncbi:MAG: phytoene/squalene synthase family protein [Ilumatobacteraceae bacterium]